MFVGPGRPLEVSEGLVIEKRNALRLTIRSSKTPCAIARAAFEAWMLIAPIDVPDANIPCHG